MHRFTLGPYQVKYRGVCPVGRLCGGVAVTAASAVSCSFIYLRSRPTHNSGLEGLLECGRQSAKALRRGSDITDPVGCVSRILCVLDTPHDVGVKVFE
jgi:hypothetical protein